MSTKQNFGVMRFLGEAAPNFLGNRHKGFRRSDCLKSQAIVNKKTWVGALTQQRNAALDSAVSGTG
ncbi:hypothetical protein [Nostoc sp. ATCC 53789]|uniref:hypothetical protein n=1 Tax=Nostoc sp. ATCC 53789 TaxID=76335 RepID=UPI00132E8BCE|nr:hypothetical protein [Nostoc sp. ATCC 53789]QHG14856.1 hypothetical protein GJB62_01880 [Nostoc sp. ATCC 53789]